MTKDEAPASPKDAALKLAARALLSGSPYEEGQAFAAITQALTQPEQPAKALLLTDQQLRDMCVKYGWDDSYQSIKAYRTVEAMSLELNQLEK